MRTRKTSKRLPTTLTAAEADALRAACSRSATGLRNRAMLEAMLGAGLRVSEVVALMPADVDWQAGQIRVNLGKGGKDRVVPVDNTTLAHLSAWQAKRADLGYNGRHPFFCGIRTGGRRMTAQNVQAAVKKLAERAGLEKHVHPHLLRHTYATWMLDQEGVTLEHLRKLLGHSDLSTTQVYLHVSDADLRRVVQGKPDPQVQAAAEALAGLSEEQRQALVGLLQGAGA